VLERFQGLQSFQKGEKNTICDVEGVQVGHATLSGGDAQTGVTVILPSINPFKEKLPANACVINAFGKAAGLLQVMELGVLESPIALCSTLSVGNVWQAVCDRLIAENPGLTTVNPVVLECNDSYLNDIRAVHVGKDLINQAFLAASETFEQGAVGAGRGMVSFGLKGGIGSASRVTEFKNKSYTIGALTLCNYGRLDDLTIAGEAVGKQIKESDAAKKEDVGSVIVILATDMPLSPLQMKRCCNRVQTGLARLGNHVGNHSGEFVLMFSTSNSKAETETAFLTAKELNDCYIDTVFRMVIEATEEAALRALLEAETVTGFQGHTARALRDACS
jgi:D-aminopeptidase